MNGYHIAGLGVILALIVGLSICSGRKTAVQMQGFSAPVVSGLIMGTLVGGSSTIGTAQLAFSYGMSAWWFTLGGGIACAVLAVVYAKPLRRSGCATLVGILSKEYGAAAGLTASVLNGVGTFINIISQLISASAVLAVVFPSMGILTAVLVSALLMLLYVLFGGARGAGMVGILKMVLLSATMLSCGILVLWLTDGPAGWVRMVKELQHAEGIHFFSLFARGVGVDLGSGLSLILGVLTTQTYAQAVISGRTDRAAVRGGLACALMIPPVGLGGILVGLYMRASFPHIDPKTALTTFIMKYMPAFPAGIMLGVLFIAVVGTGAGLALGIASMLHNDVLKNLRSHALPDLKNRAIFSCTIALVLTLACCFSTGALGDLILQFAYMSLALRGAVVLAPLCGALWFSGRIAPQFAITAILLGPLCVFLFTALIPLPFDALFVGIAAAMIAMIVGLLLTTKSTDA